MCDKGLYEGKTEEEVITAVKKLGFDPIKISDPPGHIYPPHTHPETKLLAFLEGSMKVKAGGESFDCEAGDQLIIPGNMLHSAVVGEKGCTFLWSENLVE